MKLSYLIILLPFLWLSCKREPCTIHILNTTDIHGEIGKPLSGICSYVQKVREENPGQVILLDGGDLLQGSPEIIYANYVDTIGDHILTKVLNTIDYTCISVGNHDFEAGKKIQERIYSHLKMPIINANIVDKKSNKPIFKPYVVVKKNGYKIAILGLVTPLALDWLPENLRNGSKFLPLYETAQYWTNIIYKKESPDLVIGLLHTGTGFKTFSTNQPDTISKKDSLELRNSGLYIAQNVTGIDLILCGHTHRQVINRIINNNGDSISVIESGNHAKCISHTKVTITPNGKRQKPTISTATQIIQSDTLQSNSKLDILINQFLVQAQQFNKKTICYIDSTIHSDDALWGSSAWVDLLHRSFKIIAKERYNIEVDLSFASASMESGIIKEGPMTIKDFVLLYPYENTMSIMEMTGKEIKEYLEYIYDLRIEHPNRPIYDFDSASGIFYTVNPNKPKGERVIIESLDNGNKFHKDKRYLVGMNSYRAFGGGRHFEYGLNWNPSKIKSRIIFETDKGFRELMVLYYSSHQINVSPLNQWAYISSPQFKMNNKSDYNTHKQLEGRH